jgi:hypothetical protein
VFLTEEKKNQVEDNWNMHLTNLVRTSRDGRVTHLEHAYVRGSQIRFVILPGFFFFFTVAS